MANPGGRGDKASRTFETRVQFIHDIFANKHTKTQIMAHSIQYKLGKSYDTYIKKIHKSAWTLYGEDPIKVLRRIDNFEKNLK